MLITHLGGDEFLCYNPANRRALMTIAAYFEQKARREREKNIAIGRDEERAEWLAWDARRREAEVKGLLFDEPYPGDEEEVLH